MLGVVKDVPVPRDAPPVADAYQLMVPADAVAPKVTVPASHLAAGVVPAMVGMGLIVTVITLPLSEHVLDVTTL